MLFNSAIFLLAFLPASLIGFFALGTSGHRRLAVVWLTIASLFFYGWWNPAYLPLLLASMAANYALGRLLARHRNKPLLVAGVVANLALLGYYKYAGFFMATVDGVLGASLTIPDIALPLAISFFTFQQIAFLIDSYDGVAEESNFANYAMFITFFPHLIAGPITHHKEMLPQFEDGGIFRPQPKLIALGSTLFALGLFKKVILADGVAQWVRPAFEASDAGHALTLFEAWAASIGYALQIYFDFSGYSDMAIGLGMLFGIRLPVNFNSPYKARNIIEFWSRWHMTLTRFLTAYIYNPITLALTRARMQRGKPVLRRGKTTLGAFLVLVALPTLVTMFLSGFWHGAGWQYIAFGVLHGVYLVVNHGWRTFKARRGRPLDSDKPLVRAVSVLTTFACVIVALVFFRSADVGAALNMLAGMVGAHGAMLPNDYAALPGVYRLAGLLHIQFAEYVVPAPVELPMTQLVSIAALLAIVWLLPNTQQWMGRFETGLGSQAGGAAPAPGRRVAGLIPAWRPTVAFGVLVGCVGFVTLMRALSAAPSEFLYFQF